MMDIVADLRKLGRQEERRSSKLSIVEHPDLCTDLIPRRLPPTSLMPAANVGNSGPTGLSAVENRIPRLNWEGAVLRLPGQE